MNRLILSLFYVYIIVLLATTYVFFSTTSPLTGHASYTPGEVKTNEYDVAVNFVDPIFDFGEIGVDDHCAYCEILSNGSYDEECCIIYREGSGNLLLRNDGRKVASVELEGTGLLDLIYQAKPGYLSTKSNDITLSCKDGYEPMWRSMDPAYICGDQSHVAFYADDRADEAELVLRLRIYNDTPTDTYTTAIVASASTW
ncbi:hypothetical protein H6504_02065 [Candidatus Woesearchaeota archaeon]|nr:hypothetical protein [Candidatus Woesearchaeota archaeon]